MKYLVLALWFVVIPFVVWAQSPDPSSRWRSFTLLPRGKSVGQTLIGGHVGGLTLKSTSDPQDGFNSPVQVDPNDYLQLFKSGTFDRAGPWFSIIHGDIQASHGGSPYTVHLHAGLCSGTGGHCIADAAGHPVQIRTQCDVDADCKPSAGWISNEFGFSVVYDDDSYVFDGTRVFSTAFVSKIHGTGTYTRTVHQSNEILDANGFNLPPEANATFSLDSYNGFQENVAFNPTASSGTTGTVGVSDFLQWAPIVYAGWTISSYAGLHMSGPTNTGSIGNGGTVSTIYGLKYDAIPTQAAGSGDNSVGVTNQRVIESALAANAANWFIHETGTAVSNFTGGIRIGDLTQPTVALELGSSGALRAFNGSTDYTSLSFGNLTGGTAVGDALNIFASSNTGSRTNSGGNLQLLPDTFTVTQDNSYSGVNIVPVMTLGGTSAGAHFQLVYALALGNATTNWTMGEQDGTFGDIVGVGFLPTIISNNHTSAGSVRGFFTNAVVKSATNASTYGDVTFARSAFTIGGDAVTNTVTTVNGYVDAPVNAASSTITNRFGLDINDVSNSGTVTNNTGLRIAALTSGGTIDFPVEIGEAAIKGSVPSGFGVMGVQSGAPNRWYFENESSQVHVAGETSFFGAAASTLSTSAANFFPIMASGSPNATENLVSPRPVTPGPIHLVGMSCGLSVTTGAAKSYAFVPMANGSAVTNVTCTITNGTACSVWPATTDAVAATNPLTIRATPSGTPTAATASCTVYYTVDAL